MTPRQKAAAIATQFEGRCTCAMMDGGVDCPWCQVYYDVLQGYPIVPPGPSIRNSSFAPKARIVELPSVGLGDERRHALALRQFLSERYVDAFRCGGRRCH